ncbi:unnamed protein product (macronuclear) [Paramecium tetraurelia]|uniref:EGF-like domain-containing protein n=1 Tax=Paramecium tetraurelia TaxID=5888 RepID=A0E4R7_PARTE|nr:uncharacterized protein GSPATT00023459001 [Paramecium tetraurelia]CAK90284.1 unnamed protein product [Paramecium tetraurelia]|eukprot:XP_001457681.1 hypothetical protein (macronuclear) [Paramecium tetraurelia strain d4-2]
MTFMYLLIMWLIQVCLGFRSFQAQFKSAIFDKKCFGSSQYFPGIYPHLCASIAKQCIGATGLTIRFPPNGLETMCHPQVQGYEFGPNPNSHLYFGKYPYTLVYSYDQNGNVIFTTESIPQFSNNGCLIGQKYNGVYKCQYCSKAGYGENCSQSFAALCINLINSKECGSNCKTCDPTVSFCATCEDGYSQLNSNDQLCTLKCQATHKTCQKVGGVYSFSECKDGYELSSGQCVACPTNCKTCFEGDCQVCTWPYELKDSQCLGDKMCMKYDFIYDSNGIAVDTDCQQCDIGFFKKGTHCVSCQQTPGTENCFLCDKENECKSCFATHYLTPDKKCALIIEECNPICQSCYVTQPDYCTTCFTSQKRSSRIVPGQCVCDQMKGYAELDGECILCTTGYCLTCTLIFGECTSCDPLQNRSLIGDKCPCMQGYYDTGLEDKICQKCYYSCYNCSGPLENNCTDCGDPNIYHKELVDGKCICAPRTIDVVQNDGSTLCKDCHPRCQKCQFPNDNSSNQYCSMCIVVQNRTVSSDLKCVCKKGYGEDGIVDICFKCHYTCQSCNGLLATNCTVCSSQKQRHLTAENKCLCNPGYYDTGRNDTLCYLACHNSCLSCNLYGEDKCTGCPSSRYPDRIGSTFKCLCNDPHYYSDDESLECQECHSSCKTCNGMSETNCLSCDLTYRQLIISKCVCPYGYYDVGTLQCSSNIDCNYQECFYTCMTCYGSNIDNCITCFNDSNRIVKANKCGCLDAYLEQNVGDTKCQKCSYRCALCSGSVDHCDKCPDFSYRDLGTDNSCKCPPKSYDEPGNPKCILCHSTCLTCNGNKSNQCTSCNTLIGRYLTTGGECLCASKYFDIGQAECKSIIIIKVLIACNKDCLECNISADNCTSCPPEKYLNGSVCICKTKLQGLSLSTYQPLNKLQCLNCHYSCLKCTGSNSNQCSSCQISEKRIQSGQSCNCKDNYFDIGKPLCSLCNYRCYTCVTLETQCLSCPPQSLRVLSNSLCQCPAGYYDDGVNINCQKCHYSCSTCIQLSTKCVTCSFISLRSFNSSLDSCPCNDNFYDAEVEICQACHYSCLICDGQLSSQCKTCPDQNISFRVYNNNSGSCQCKIGYYDDGYSVTCKKCKIQCFACQNQEYTCTSCPLTRHLNGNQCDCDKGYYDTGQEKCTVCDSSCINCIHNSITCTECDSTQSKILDSQTHKCVCETGSTEINGICQKCDITCKTCVSSPTFCTSCGLLRALKNNKCQCIDGTYETGTNKQCLLCNQTCLTCITQDNYCLSCSADNFRIIKTGNICVCKDGYFEDPLQQCVKCDLSCLTCQGNSQFCLTCDSMLNLQITNQNKCICMPSYYFNTLTLKCEACNKTCKECLSATQCLECEPITRYYDTDTLKCPCKDGFYEANQKMCQQCDFSCKTCANQSTKCLTCQSIYFRNLKNIDQCLCQDGYFDVGIEMCQKCNSLCKTCQSNSTKCLSCFESEQLRILTTNQCICKPGYFDNGQLICEKCSNTCLTCQGKNNYCTSCDVNQNRIDQSVIHKCPCLSNFFQDQNETCQKCHIKCSGCTLKMDKCISCKPSNTSNRLSISQNCDCKDGYYDDGVQLQCQKCYYQCKTCQQKPSNCLLCLTNLRENPPLCNCKAGYFENEQFTCEPCDNKCNTCEIKSSNCTSCKGSRFNKACDCQDGYFEAGQPNCLQCDFKCLTCQGSQSHCLTCRGDRINYPECNCKEGLYDDNHSTKCKECDLNCKTCDQVGCLGCNGNRILSEDKTCNCPLNSISHEGTPWCSSCEVAVLDIRLSDDLLSIKVLFDFPLNLNYFQSQFKDNICFKFLAAETIKQLGNNPQCVIDEKNNKQLILKLGDNAAILPENFILFKNNSFSHKNCQKKLNTFIFNHVKYPINLLQPEIQYDLPQYLLNPCDDNTILIKSKSQDGFRAFNSITWTYLLEGQNGNGNLKEFVLYQTTFQQLDLMIPIQTLPKLSKITFFLEFQNFIGQKGKYQFQVQTHNGNYPTVLWLGQKKYFTFETINLQFSIQKKNCSSQTDLQNDSSVDNSKYSVSIVEILRNDSMSRSSNVNFSQIINENYYHVTIEKYKLTPLTAYTFQMQTNESKTNFSNSQNIIIEILQGGLLCQFNGTKDIQNYRKDLKVNIQCIDLDYQYDWNEDPDIAIEVSCTDLTQGTVCMDINKKVVKINKTDSTQYIKKMNVLPFTIWVWTVIASKSDRTYKFSQNIVFLEDDFSILDVDYSKGYIMRPINNYETLQFQFNIPFEDRYQLLQYQVAIIYDYELVKILEPLYFQYKLRLYDQYQEFNKGNQFYLKFFAQFTNNIIPSQQQIKMTLNQPPICIIYLKSQRVQALQSQKIVANCQFSEDYPFTYQLRYFLNEQDYQEFQNKLSDYSLILNGFQRFNYFEALLPYSKGVALVQIMDSRGSITNIEEHLDVQKIELNCTEFLQSNFTYKKQVIMLLEVIMNHYDKEGCVQFQEQLVNSIKGKIDSDDLFEQLLALQTIKLYKRFKVNLSNSNLSARVLAEINQESCYDNMSQLFLINNNKTQKYSSTDIFNFVLEFQQLKNSASKILSKGTNLDDEIKQNDIFLNEQLFQSKQQISNSLVAIILFVDDLFLKISQTAFSQKEDKEQIFQLSKDLIALIEEMLEFTNTQVPVNGQDFVLNGQILKYQSAKVTKDVFNQQEGLDKDIMDGLIVYVQKEQMDIYFNYLNVSEKHVQDIKTVLNKSSSEIDQSFYTITKLRNYLYKNQYRDYEKLKINYLIDVAQYSYCVDVLLPAYNFQCFQYDSSETLQQCQLQTTEINNKTVQVSCQCSQLGIIFMTKYKNSSSDELEIVQILNSIQADDTNCNINNQPFLLFHGIYIVFTLFIYYELQKFEIPQNKDAQNIFTERSPKASDEQKQKYDQLKCSPGNLEIFKFSFKVIFYKL